MAYKGKNTCRILKDIRRQIAEANDIDLVIKECTYQGDCKGTCPRCEAEVAYLERELARRQAMGKAVCISGIAASALLGMPAAAAQTQPARLAVQDTTAVAPEWEEEGVVPGPPMGIMPEFPGGQGALLRFLAENMKYPADAAKEGKEGRAICRFWVQVDGSVTDVKVVRSSGDDRLDAEAVRVLQSMPKWTPGRGNSVAAMVYSVPINFSIPKEESAEADTTAINRCLL